MPNNSNTNNARNTLTYKDIKDIRRLRYKLEDAENQAIFSAVREMQYFHQRNMMREGESSTIGARKRVGGYGFPSAISNYSVEKRVLRKDRAKAIAIRMLGEKPKRKE